MALKSNGVVSEVSVVRDGEEALHYFSEGKYSKRDPFALNVVILLDLMLPKLSGLEVLERLRTEPPAKDFRFGSRV